MDKALRATFRKPFSEQVAAFRLRLQDLVPTSAWNDLERNAHDSAFMVAGATKADLLADLAAAVDRAISEGTGIEAFRKDFADIVKRHGWHGWTGEGTAAGEAWRTRVIFATNLRVSMAAGRLAQLRDGNFPFWVYRHSGSGHPRLHHLAWDGLVLETDHPFWARHYPPNGWGCGCFVRGTRSKRRASKVGGDPSKTLPDGWDATDPRTGAPKGIGKGWDYAPGSTVSITVQSMTRKTIKWPYVLQKEFMADLPEATVNDFARAYRQQPALKDATRGFFNRVLSQGHKSQDVIADEIGRQYLTWGRLTSEHVNELSQLGIDAAGYDFAVEVASVQHIRAHLNDKDIGLDDVVAAPARLDTAASFDTQARARGDARGAVQVAIRVEVNGKPVRLVFQRRRARRMLTLVTMFKVK